MDPQQFGPYRLEELLGRGGMGDVHRAFDTVRGRTVALKRLRPELAADVEFQARFRRECRLAARLREAHVVPIHDFGEIDGRLYLDMRLIEGPDLATLLAEHGPLPPHRAVDVVSQVASALDAAHAEGMVHRDVKPSNVLLAGEGATGHDFAYLTDFGVAGAVGPGRTSLTVTGATVGTLDYIAPERFQGRSYDGRADVYSLACVLHEALTGRPPFGGESLAAMIHAHLHLEPPRPSRQHAGIPTELDTVIARGMAKNPEARYPTPRALADAARATLSPAPQETLAVAGPQPVTATQLSRRTPATSTPDGPWPVSAARPSSPRQDVPPRSVADTGTSDRPSRSATGRASGGPSRSVADTEASDVPSASGGPKRSVAGTEESPVGAGRSTLPYRRRSRILVPGLILLAVFALAAAGVAGWYFVVGTPSPAAATVVKTEPVQTIGENPFMPPVGTDQRNVLPPPKTGGTFAGNTPGLYGGTGDNASCDPNAMVAFLREHPDKANAWAGVLGIAPGDIPNYVADLTPVILRSDTAVTNHGFAGGRATTLNSVLQAGTAVLVDSHGVPRVRCYCGNPLTPAVQIATPTYVGLRWPAFSPSSVTIVQPSSVVIDVFVVVETFTNRVLYQPRGSSGSPDRPLREVSPPSSEPSSTSPEPSRSYVPPRAPRPPSSAPSRSYVPPRSPSSAPSQSYVPPEPPSSSESHMPPKPPTSAPSQSHTPPKAPTSKPSSSHAPTSAPSSTHSQSTPSSSVSPPHPSSMVS
jgi:serine/threonine protein kinase